MRRSTLCSITAFLALAALPAVSAAGDASRTVLSMSVAPAQDNNGLVVSGSAGRYDRVETVKITVPLQLEAHMSDDATGYRILKSELFLKSDGAGATARVIDALAAGAPDRSLAKKESFAFDLSPSGPVAQDAIAACNAGAGGEMRSTRLPVAVVWRVTTGRFNFKWTGYDHVAPSDDIVSNRDYYSDQASSDVETVIDMPVRCEPLQPLPASIAANRSDAPSVISPARFVPVQPAASNAAPSLAPAPVPQAPRATSVEPESPRIVSAQSATKPMCDGGMLRQLGGADAGYLCLCPGNTERIATGENAFSCEKRSRRR